MSQRSGVYYTKKKIVFKFADKATEIEDATPKSSSLGVAALRLSLFSVVVRLSTSFRAVRFLS